LTVFDRTCRKCGEILFPQDAKCASCGAAAPEPAVIPRSNAEVETSQDSPPTVAPRRVTWVLRIFAGVIGLLLILTGTVGLLMQESTRSAGACGSALLLSIGSAAILRVAIRRHDV
jgi:hypothetical protein